MREKIVRHGGLWLAFAGLAVLLLSAAALAQEGTPMPVPEEALAGTSTATVTISSDGISISPARPGPGAVTYTVINNTNRARGLVISGEDRADTPIIRYSDLISPGRSDVVEFWMYLGKSYTFRDYTSRRVVGDELRFSSTFSTSVTYPAPAGFGAGPSFDRQQVAVSLTDSGMNMGEIEGGPTTFVVTNNSSRSRGLVISGEDRAGNPIIRYSKVLQPGQSTRLEFWMYGQQNYTFRDYTSRRVSSGNELVFNSSFSESVTVPEIPLPPRFGSGPGTESNPMNESSE